jgi:signal transduction histidine kinase
MKHERSEPVSEDHESEALRRTQRELERVKARLERLQQRKSSLLAMAAHDLRTPVAIIQGYSELLAGALAAETDAAIREYLTTIVAHATSLRHGIENLVALDQMERGEVQLTAVRCDLNDLVAQALAQVEGLMTIKSIDITIDAPPEPIWVAADEEQVGRALYSLFGHAEKYAREHGPLIFTVAAAGEFGLVTVRDPNRLLAEPMVSRAFDLVEIGRDGRAALRGTDLGLVVARRVAEAHGGRAAVQSEAGQGTTFALYLPLAAEE